MEDNQIKMEDNQIKMEDNQIKMEGNQIKMENNNTKNNTVNNIDNDSHIEGVARGDLKLERTQDFIDLSFAGYSFIIGAGIFSLMPHITDSVMAK